jgi:hypothetical protein
MWLPETKNTKYKIIQEDYSPIRILKKMAFGSRKAWKISPVQIVLNNVNSLQFQSLLQYYPDIYQVNSSSEVKCVIFQI